METSSNLQILVGLLIRTLDLFVGNVGSLVGGLSVSFSVGANADELVGAIVGRCVGLITKRKNRKKQPCINTLHHITLHHITSHYITLLLRHTTSHYIT